MQTRSILLFSPFSSTVKLAARAATTSFSTPPFGRLTTKSYYCPMEKRLKITTFVGTNENSESSEAPFSVAPLSELFNGEELVVNLSGEKRPASDVLNGLDLVGLYFAAGWCPHCRQFTPKLKKFYEELKGGKGKKFEVVFVSRDRAAEELIEYYQKHHADWTYLEFGSPKIRELLQAYKLMTLPALRVVDPVTGRVVVAEGQKEIAAAEEEGKPAEKLWEQWLAQANSVKKNEGENQKCEYLCWILIISPQPETEGQEEELFSEVLEKMNRDKKAYFEKEKKPKNIKNGKKKKEDVESKVKRQGSKYAPYFDIGDACGAVCCTCHYEIRTKSHLRTSMRGHLERYHAALAAELRCSDEAETRAGKKLPDQCLKLKAGSEYGSRYGSKYSSFFKFHAGSGDARGVATCRSCPYTTQLRGGVQGAMRWHLESQHPLLAAQQADEVRGRAGKMPTPKPSKYAAYFDFSTREFANCRSCDYKTALMSTNSRTLMRSHLALKHPELGVRFLRRPREKAQAAQKKVDSDTKEKETEEEPLALKNNGDDDDDDESCNGSNANETQPPVFDSLMSNNKEDAEKTTANYHLGNNGENGGCG